MKVLVIHNSDSYRITLQTLLQSWGYEAVVAADSQEAEQILLESEDPPRLAIVDGMMPGLSGFELCERIRERQRSYVYVIMTSADARHSSLYKAYESGADEYMGDLFSNGILRLRLRVAERILESHQVLTAARDALKFEASHDPLLKLWNRKAILNLLTIELSRAKRMRAPLSIFFADLDHFKQVNDRHGHLVGDEVLRSAASRMAGEMREYDHLGRYGGEEFLAVLPNCDSEVAREVAERVRRSLAERPILTKSTSVEITVSIGVAQWRGGEQTSELLEEADLALYRAKDSGRNRVEVQGGMKVEGRPPGEPAPVLDFQTPPAHHAAGPSVAKVGGSSIRRNRRFVFDRPLEIITLYEGTPGLLQARIRDISESGLGAVVPRSLELNQDVTLHFQVEAGSKCTVVAAVRYCNWPYVGFEFTFVEPAVREAIARLGRDFLGNARTEGPSIK
jgi:diguanylate cyclase (GGDEF)-like protein